jgi:hypothetical protein
MKVKELVRRLQKMDPERQVVFPDDKDVPHVIVELVSTETKDCNGVVTPVVYINPPYKPSV